MPASPLPSEMAKSLSSRPIEANRLTGGLIMTRAMNMQLVLGGVDRLDDRRIRSAETVAEHVDVGDAHSCAASER